MANNEEIEIIDWSLITKRLVGVFSWLGSWYLPATVFVVPLLVFSYGFPAPIIKQILLLTLVGLGALGWLVGALWRREDIIWQSSPLSWAAAAVVIAALVSSLAAADPVSPWGLRGGLNDNGPLVWLSVIGLAVLMVQQAKGNILFFRRVLFAYLAASSFLAVFVIGWWIFKQELITPAIGLFSVTSLWFAVNILVLAATTLIWRGRIRIAALVLLALHLIVVFAYDYDLVWYFLAAGGLIFSLIQLLFEKKLPHVDFRLSFGLIILSVILLFLPVERLSPKLGFEEGSIQTISARVAWPRYYQNILKSDPILGVGLGLSSQSFWNSAELVDMRQISQFPDIGNGYISILWEGGLVFLAVFIFFIFCLSRALRRLFSGAGGNSALAVAVFLGWFGWLVVLALAPVNFTILFSLGVFAGLIGVAFSSQRVQIAPRKGTRSFLIFGIVLVGLFLLVVVSFSFYEARGRFNFLSSVKADKSGTSVDMEKLEKVISGHNWVFGYRLARIDFVTQALNEAKTDNPDFKVEQMDVYLKTIKEDYRFLKDANLTASQSWFTAWRAEQIGFLLGGESAKEWLGQARYFYEKGLALLPRNVIIFTDIARFYRQQAADILREGETKDALYRQAHALLDKALAIDDTYEQAFLGRSQLLAVEGKNEEALESLKSLAEKNPAASYNAGHLAFTSQKFDEAVKYFKKAIEQNNNHLQARYELVQAYLAAGDNKSAALELDELEKRTPSDDTATRTLLKGLRELVK